jgi:glycosyltransferase involved in cell wall biosynthesis
MTEVKNPRVSVVIPTYNRAPLLGRAIQSVLNQTYQDFEVIVVDDASTDNTEGIVKGFNCGKIKYIRHEKNKGGAAARNTGIKEANFDYIAFQDSDDEWLPEKLEQQMNIFKTVPPDVGVVYTGFWRVEGIKKTYIPSSQVRLKEGYIHYSLLEGNFVTTPAAVVKKECFEKAGAFDESLPRFQDWELWIRISKYYQFKYINEPLVISYYTPDSISTDQNGLIIACKLILEKHFEDLKKHRKLLAKHYCSRGILLCSTREFRQGRSYHIKAIKAYPLNIKVLLLAFLSLFGQTAYKKILQCYQRANEM